MFIFIKEKVDRTMLKGSDDLKVSASQPRDRGFEHHTGHDHDSSYDTSTGWFHNRAKINMVKLNLRSQIIIPNIRIVIKLNQQIQTIINHHFSLRQCRIGII